MVKNKSKNIPGSVAIIMDGNRRWAKKNNKSTPEGHRAGYSKLLEVLDWSKEKGIKCLIIYAFSTENWGRSTREVSYLMDLFRTVLGKEADKIKKEKIRIRFIGERKDFSKDIQKMMTKLEEDTKDFKEMTLVIATSYGGRREIIHAVKRVLREKTPSFVEKMRESDLSKFFYTDDIPDPDLIIRTSGEMRLSNFLLWQSAYSELFFINTLWPDFSKKEFDKIINEYEGRSIRKGK